MKLEFELRSYDDAVQYVNHYTRGIPPVHIQHGIFFSFRFFSFILEYIFFIFIFPSLSFLFYLFIFFHYFFRSAWMSFTFFNRTLLASSFILIPFSLTLSFLRNGVMIKALNSRIVVSESGLQSKYYVQFQTNTLGKGMNPFIPPNHGLNSTLTVLQEGWFGH